MQSVPIREEGQHMKNRLHILTVVLILTIVTIACQFGSDIARDPTPESESMEILFQDDFSDNSGNWYTFVDDTGITDYENEGFRININECTEVLSQLCRRVIDGPNHTIFKHARFFYHTEANSNP